MWHAQQRCLVAACMVAFCTMSTVVEGQLRYTMLPLGGLANSRYSTANAINELGQVTGGAEIGPNEQRAFRTAPNQPIDPATDSLGTLGGPLSIGYDINDLGQVVGESRVLLPDPTSGSHDLTRAFRTGPNSPINPETDNLETFGGSYTVAFAINNLGQVVGHANNRSLVGNAFRSEANAPIDPVTDNLGYDDSKYTYAQDINDAGQVVGFASQGAFRTSANATINPATDFFGDDSFIAYSINESGQVAGALRTHIGGPGVYAHAFLSGSNGSLDEVVDLGTLGGLRSYAHGLNDLGVVVGRSELKSESSLHAFVFHEAKLYDLNDLVDNLDGWTLEEARDINNKGQIVGYATRNGIGQAYVLTPIPTFVTGDVNGDGSVNLTDFGILRQHMGLAGVRADGDLSGDGRVDIVDFGVLKDNFGRSAAVPEPTALVGLLIGAASEFMRRLLRRARYGNTPGKGAAACGFAV